MKLIKVAASALVMAVTPVAAHAAPQTSPTKQSYCEFVIIETQDTIEIAGFCLIFSDGSF